jgi:hypothetical protein
MRYLYWYQSIQQLNSNFDMLSCYKDMEVFVIYWWMCKIFRIFVIFKSCQIGHQNLKVQEEVLIFLKLTLSFQIHICTGYVNTNVNSSFSSQQDSTFNNANFEIQSSHYWWPCKILKQEGPFYMRFWGRSGFCSLQSQIHVWAKYIYFTLNVPPPWLRM